MISSGPVLAGGASSPSEKSANPRAPPHSFVLPPACPDLDSVEFIAVKEEHKENVLQQNSSLTDMDGSQRLLQQGISARCEGKFHESEVLLSEALNGFIVSYGDRHMHTLYAASNLADTLIEQRKYREAERVIRTLCETTASNLLLSTVESKHQEPIVSGESLDGLLENVAFDAQLRLVRVLHETGQCLESVECAYAAWETCIHRFGKVHKKTLSMMEYLCRGMLKLGALADREYYFVELYQCLRSVHGEFSTPAFIGGSLLGEYYLAVERLGEASDWLNYSYKGLARTLGNTDLATLRVRLEWANLQARLGDSEQALIGLRDIFCLQDALKVQDDLESITTAFRVGTLLFDLKKWTDSKVYFQRVVSASLVGNVEGLTPAMIFKSKFCLARIFQSEDNIEQAIKYFDEINSTADTGLDKLSHTQSLSELGVCYVELGKYGEAQKILRKAMQLFDAYQFKTVHQINYIETQDALGVAYHRDEMAAARSEALVIHQSALHESQKSLGRHHIVTMRIMGHLAVSLMQSDSLAKAENMFIKAIEIQESTANFPRKTLMETNVEYAICLSKMSKYKSAKPIFLSSVAWFKENLGPQHRRSLFALRELSKSYLRQGDYESAEEVLSSMRSLILRAGKDSNFETVDITIDLAVAQLELKKLSDSESMLRCCIQRLESDDSIGLPQSTKEDKLCVVYDRLGFIYQATKRHRDASNILSKFLNLLKSRKTTDPDGISACKLRVGLNLYAQGNYSDAEIFLLDHLEYLRGEDNKSIETLSVIGFIIENYLASADLESAGQYLAELDYRERRNAKLSQGSETSVWSSRITLPDFIQGNESLCESKLREQLAWRFNPSLHMEFHVLLTMSYIQCPIDRKESLYAAEERHRRALLQSRAIHGDTSEETLSKFASLGWFLYCVGKFIEAELPLRTAYGGRLKLLGELHISSIESLYHIALWTEACGLLVEAERLHEQVYELARKALDTKDEFYLTVLDNLGFFYLTRRKFGTAKALFEEATKGFRASLGGLYFKSIQSARNAGMVTWAMEKRHESNSSRACTIM